MEYKVSYGNQTEVIATADEQMARLIFIKHHGMLPSQASRLVVVEAAA